MLETPRPNLPPPSAPPAVFAPSGASVERRTAIAFPAGVQVANPWLRLGSCLLEAVLMALTLGVGWIIWAAMIASTGQTPAKSLLKLRVITADTIQPAGFARMVFMRGLIAGWIGYLVAVFTLGILFFMPFWDRRHQNLWDKVSNTYVVTDPHDAWNTRPNLRG
ncbi:MAG TPA: RDD family protein [Acidimicrobiia bacterium]|jgi:uncharacterized RDD family membrane protein YckC|nr:RDD family protein [Acidimicrobiia bacterium]